MSSVRWIAFAIAFFGGLATASAQNNLFMPYADTVSTTDEKGKSVPAPQPSETVLFAPSDSCNPCNLCDPCKGDGDGKDDKWGPALPEDVQFFQYTNLGKKLKEKRTRVYGWVDMGYTYASTNDGILTVEPRENRFGNEWLFSQIAVAVEKTLDPKELSFGYNALFYAGADAALLRPRGGFTTTDPRFGADFRHLYLSAHLPILTEGGVDLRVGRQTTIIGYNSALAPYRPFYSSDYQWFYSQDGAYTGAVATWHVNKQLDLVSGVTLGANTFFTLRDSGPAYIGQINYWLQEEKKTLLSASVHTGDQAIFSAPGFEGNYLTMIELRLQQNWNKYFSQVVQSDMGWETSIPGVGTGEWYGLYNIFLFHMTKTLDMNFRAEWFHDIQGSRTGFIAQYGEVTLGWDYHPQPWFRFRPEVRGDFADNPVFRNGLDKNQLTVAFDVLLQF